jgi:hypothetical protein
VRAVDVMFDPKTRVVAVAADARLGFASFTERWVSGACRRVPEPRAFVGKLGPELRRPLRLHCAASKPLRIHVNPIRGDGAVVGSSFQVGFGDPLQVIASAILKNRGSPYASRIYRDPKYCRLA